MSNMVLQPPEITDVNGALIFLNGPIQDGPNWQRVAIETFEELDSGLTIASPRKDYPPGEFVYENQVDWETHHRQIAHRNGVNMFWLANQTNFDTVRSYAQTSRGELFESKMYHQFLGSSVVIGIEKGFGNERYIRRRFGQDCPDIPILSSLKDTCEVTLETLESSSV